MEDKFKVLLVARYNSLRAGGFMHRKIILLLLRYESEWENKQPITRASPTDVLEST